MDYLNAKTFAEWLHTRSSIPPPVFGGFQHAHVMRRARENMASQGLAGAWLSPLFTEMRGSLEGFNEARLQILTGMLRETDQGTLLL